MNLRIPALITALALVFGAWAQAEVEFQKGDSIVYLGNSLADRMQHDAWLETLIQSKEGAKQLSFRNLGLSGDRVANRPRNRGFMPVDDYLKHLKADVIFSFFGYNESFDGDGGLAKFKDELGKMVDSYRALKPNGESEPRIVLFAPIAHEDLGSRNLPDEKENNERLAKYAAATKEVAEAKKAGFVDLFAISSALYDASEAPLTINGIHLNAEGNRLVGEKIAQQLLGSEIAASGELEALREAVLDKNDHWFQRYRAVDGNDIWGGRSTLKFVDDQSNAEVLQQELVMLDVMANNRDERIWALATGGDQVVDDSNVPKPIPVISNVGGGSKSSNAQKEGSLEYVSGEEGAEMLKVRDGFEVNLFADEKMFPQLVNPVQMQVDGKGRLWVASWPTYPKVEPLQPRNDALLILPDEDRDGVADKVIEFAKIDNPLGFEFWNGGVIVSSQPDLIFLKDTDGDDIADVRHVILQGIGSADTHHAANNLIYGPDGAIYWQSGVFLMNNMEHP
ncbi:MAG: GDSL-type esterase/lipase family protein, partial [Verrucomicrobiota bacterium]